MPYFKPSILGSAFTSDNITIGSTAPLTTVGRGASVIPSNLAFGVNALSAQTAGSFNVALGFNAMQNITGTSFNIAIGSGALQGSAASTNNAQSSNIAIGQNSLSTGRPSTEIAIGANAGQYSSGSNNIAIGQSAFNNSAATAGSTTGTYNIYIGSLAGGGSITGVTSSFNICIGRFAGYQWQGNNNIIIADNAIAGGMSNGVTIIGWTGSASTVTGEIHIGVSGVDRIRTDNVGTMYVTGIQTGFLTASSAIVPLGGIRAPVGTAISMSAGPAANPTAAGEIVIQGGPGDATLGGGTTRIIGGSAPGPTAGSVQIVGGASSGIAGNVIIDAGAGASVGYVAICTGTALNMYVGKNDFRFSVTGTATFTSAAVTSTVGFTGTMIRVEASTASFRTGSAIVVQSITGAFITASAATMQVSASTVNFTNAVTVGLSGTGVSEVWRTTPIATASAAASGTFTFAGFSANAAGLWEFSLGFYTTAINTTNQQWRVSSTFIPTWMGVQLTTSGTAITGSAVNNTVLVPSQNVGTYYTMRGHIFLSGATNNVTFWSTNTVGAGATAITGSCSSRRVI
jgi:hypothetical protein